MTLSIDEALELILRPSSRRSPPSGSRWPRRPGAWRAEPARSAVDLPPFDRSAMDGYAVRAADTAPGVALRLVGGVAAGEVASAVLEPGTATRVSTGAAIPPGADAVLQSELAVEPDGHVSPERALAPGAHPRAARTCTPATSWRRPGRRSPSRGSRRWRPPASARWTVHRRPRLHLIVTGSELLPLGAPPEPGRIHESNGLMVRLLAERAGAEVVDHGVIGDDLEATRAAGRAGLEGDVLVVSGGVSVGPHDHVKPAFEDCGVEEVFWRVRIKPGKPLWFGRRGDTLVFGLPGNPLSTIVCFCVFIEPALRRLAGERDARPRLEPAV